jgi:uncharacterized protein (UPF0264 family)
MRLLVSVLDHQEAAAALAGNADIIDAKDPASGALGAVSIPALRDICSAARDAHLVTAALGDADDERATEDMAWAYAGAGARLVKVGFAGITNVERTASLLTAAVRGAAAGSGGRCGVVAVAYADAHCVASLTPGALTKAAVRAGTAGVLLDTANKHGPGLRNLLSQRALTSWISNAHEAGLLVAVAGRLLADDLGFVRDAGADIAGVRGAACEGGRTGRVTTEHVRQLRMLTGPTAPDRGTPHTPTGCSVPQEAPADRARPSMPG